MTFKKLKPKTPAPDRPLPDVPTVRTRGKAIHSQEQAQEIEQQRK